MRDGDRVYDPIEPTWWWSYHSLEWWAAASNGIDGYGCTVSARIEGDRLAVQHGPNPEAVRHFTLDELNNIGGRWVTGSVTDAWFDTIHGWTPPAITPGAGEDDHDQHP